MSRVSAFNNPLLLGFDHFERTLDRVAKTASDGYPPYNIEQLDDDRLRITLAVAGFAPDDLEVRVEDTQLTIRGRRQDDESERVYLYRGIAARQFQRSFVLAENMRVDTAHLDNGLLHVDLARLRPDPVVRTVEIQTGETGKRDVPSRQHGSRRADGSPRRAAPARERART